MTVKMVTSQI